MSAKVWYLQFFEARGCFSYVNDKNVSECECECECTNVAYVSYYDFYSNDAHQINPTKHNLLEKFFQENISQSKQRIR